MHTMKLEFKIKLVSSQVIVVTFKQVLWRMKIHSKSICSAVSTELQADG